MLDLKHIRDNPDAVKANNALRRSEADVDGLLELAARRGELLTEIQNSQKRQKEVAAGVKGAKGQDQRQPLIEEGKTLKVAVAGMEEELRAVEEKLADIQAQIPNLTHPDVPTGDEDAVVREVGERPKLDKPLDHVALCEKHGLADFEAGSRVTGASFYYLTGDGALLELALIHYAMRKLVEAGFTPVITPDLARTEMVAGTGYIPRGPETQIYSLDGHDLCLIATAEITLAGMFAGQMLDSAELPKKLVGLSHCFRTEAGAAGAATRGLYRVHQFTKVEMFAFCAPEASEELHREMLALEEEIFQGLEVPYRVLDIRAGDLGGPAYRKYDLEAWMPGRGEAGEWGEITSTSNCTDYQARRLKIRHKTAGQKGAEPVHMLNGTAVATSRTIIAVLENHQQPDGAVRVPEVLVPYMGKEVIGG